MPCGDDRKIEAATKREDMILSRALKARFFSSPSGLPVSFRLDDAPVAGIPGTWKPAFRRRQIDARLVETVFKGLAPGGGLEVRVECLEYLDYPVIEWTAWLANRGGAPTPVIGDLLALDAVFDGPRPVLWHCNGDFCDAASYTSEETPLPGGASLRFAPGSGRSCDRAFPYFRLMFEGRGLSLAVGWPGQWAASFESAGGGVRVKAGQERTHLRLMPGEEIRTPRIALMSWAGDSMRAANLWRRWYRDHLLPRPDGRPLGPLLAGFWKDENPEFTGATEENQLRFIPKWMERGIRPDVWWIDAGWYPCYCGKEGRRRWRMTGTWKPDPDRFPRGLGPVSECAARYGAKLLVWFEPERVWKGTELEREHPGWLLSAMCETNRLLNLGNQDARRWLTERVCGLIRDAGIGIYRQDFNRMVEIYRPEFNIGPLEYWRGNDAPDRQGMTENLHVQGYLRFWDELLERNPGLWIDSCASGGRRNDLETTRRSVPLHYSDYGYDEPEIKLCFQDVLFQWLPYFKEGSLRSRPDGSLYVNSGSTFPWHCGFGPMLFARIDIARDDYDYGMIRKMTDIWRRAADLMIRGDYYPLTPLRRSRDAWIARQFDLPEEGRGFIQAIRLPECREEKLTIRPLALRAEISYVLENPESGEVRTLSGQELSGGGFEIALPPEAGCVWFYREAGR
ncbi:MAG: alpha-galactosidase [Planctomycetota bacterium]|nr:alpha-galactosidase [Planctomycetota bacterium]